MMTTMLQSGQLQHQISMARYTSWRVGGRADRLYTPSGIDDLCRFLASLPMDMSIYFMGLGSNLLVRDGGIRGTVIVLHKALNHLESTEHTVYAEAGITCAKLAKFCAKQALGGAEFFAGIPGTLGGALAMNAGCYGQETWQVVQRVRMVNRRGDLHWRTPMAFTVHYRKVEPRIADEWFVAAELAFSTSTEAQVKQRIRTLLHTRLRQQPLDFPSAGSTFRNPPGDYAARLIEASGLKGYTIGGAQVSPKHANFIINLGHATAHDIEKLIQHIREVVWQHSGVLLEQEVKVMGEYE